jgi:hypothetical protein
MNEKNRSNDVPDWLNKKLHYWFVQYNPLYFFSALCILFGMFLISRGLEELDWRQGQLLLTAVMQLYEIVLLIGGALLFRVKGHFRPAVILGLIEMFFLFDCTFRTEMMTTIGTVGGITSVLWVALVGFKLMALIWVFRLSVSFCVVIITMLAALGIAGVPHALALFKENQLLINLGAVWYGVILIVSLQYIRPRIDCIITLDDWGMKVLNRVKKTALLMWSGFYLFHLMTWIEMFDIPFSFAYAGPFFLLWFLPKKEGWAWVGGIIIIGITSVIPSAVTPTALVVAIFYGLRARQTKQHRFYLGTVIHSYLAFWAVGWKGEILPEPNLWLILTTTMILVVMAWYWRLLSAIPASVLVMLSGAEILLPQGLLQWGSFVLVIGFTTLIAGIAVNWTQNRFKPENNNNMIKWKAKRLTDP